MKTIDLKMLQERHGGQFVATRDGEVIESAPTNKELLDRLKKKGIDITTLTFEFVHPKDRLCAY